MWGEVQNLKSGNLSLYFFKKMFLILTVCKEAGVKCVGNAPWKHAGLLLNAVSRGQALSVLYTFHTGVLMREIAQLYAE